MAEKRKGRVVRIESFLRLIYKSLIRVLTVSGGGRCFCK